MTVAGVLLWLNDTLTMVGSWLTGGMSDHGGMTAVVAIARKVVVGSVLVWMNDTLRIRLPNSPFRPSDTRDYDGLQNAGPEKHGPQICRAGESKTV
jgi:hypothetical protein